MADKKNNEQNPYSAMPTQASMRDARAMSVGADAGSGPGRPSAGAGAGARAGGTAGGGKQQNGSKRTVLVVLGCVLLAIAIWLLIWVFACGGPSMFDPNAQNGQAPYKTQEEIQAELDRTVEDGMFNISIASAIQFEDGQSEGTAYIENVPGNHYLMKVSITDDETGELLYESGVLKPNQFIENIALTRDLDAGVYAATATFTAMDQTTYEEIGKAAAKITLNVLG